MPETQEMWAWFLSQEDPLEKEMATHSSILAWEISWTEESRGLPSMGLQKIGHDLVTEHACVTYLILTILCGDFFSSILMIRMFKQREVNLLNIIIHQVEELGCIPRYFYINVHPCSKSPSQTYQAGTQKC